MAGKASGGKSGSSSSKPSAAKPAPKASPAKVQPAPKSNANRRDVVPDKSAPAAEKWKVTAPEKKTPTAAAPTQAKAEKEAKRQVAAAGGGEVKIHGTDGRIRDSDTVKPGNESSAKDTKH